MNIQKEKGLLTTEDLMDFFNVTRNTIYNWRSEGLPFIKIGRNIRFDPNDVVEWAEKKNMEG